MFQTPPKEPEAAAQAIGLRYINDDVAGISRKGKMGRFSYVGPGGKVVRDTATLARIRRLAIPPAWTDVWIAPNGSDHLQATGRDARGRKQYRYHLDFIAIRDQAKYDHLLIFANGLAALRKQLKHDLRRPGLPREKVMAAIVALLEETLIRVGNEDYARTNASFGLTTLRNRHVRVRGHTLTFEFKGKSGKKWSLSLHDRRIAKIVASCQELPGQHLFEYRDVDDAIQTVSSTDVNVYLRAVSGRDITAKDFRTWAGTVKAAIGFSETTQPPSKRVVRSVVAAVAEELGNTVAICRRCYIHPALIEAFEAGTLKLHFAKGGRSGLSTQELAVLGFLRRTQRVKRQ